MTPDAIQTWLRTRSREDRVAAFRALAEAHGPAIRRTCRSFERDPARREELVQDVLMALWRALPRLERAEAARAFVLRIAHNLSLQHVRYSAPRRAVSAPLVAPDPDPRPPADEALSRARQRARLQAAIAALPAPDRSLVLLWLEGLDHHELADATGLHPGQARTRLYRLRKRLARDLGADDA